MTVLIVILCILAFIVILVSAFIFTKIDVGLEYISKENKKKSYFRIKLFKIIPIKIKIGEDGKLVQKVIEECSSADLDEFLDFISDIVHNFKYIKKDLKNLLLDIVHKISFAELSADVKFGTGNAASTGVTTGAVWSGVAIIVKLIDEIFGVKKFSFNVNPCFQKKCFDIHFKGILRLRLVNIMTIIYKIGQIIYKFKEYSTNNKEKAVL